MDCSVASFGRR